MRKQFIVVLDGIKDGSILETAEVHPWRTQWNYYESPEEGENTSYLPSVTQQNQAISLKTLLERHTSGRPIDDYIRPGGIYDFPVDSEVGKEFWDTYQAGIPDTARMDITEKQELAKTTQAYIQAHKKEIVEQTAKKAYKQHVRKNQKIKQQEQQPVEPKKPEEAKP